MALTETVQLDIQAAQRQLDSLEQQLTDLSTPINVPVNVSGEGSLSGVTQDLDRSERAVDDLNRELRQTDDALRDVEGAADRGTAGVLRFGSRGASVFSNFRGSILGVVGAFGAIQGARAFIGFANDTIQSASDLEQSIGGVRSIFGDAADEVLEFGQSADQSVGLASSAFNQLSAQLGAQLQSFGFSAGEAATETQNLIELGADLAATFGGPVTGAVEAIGSLLRGEINPIERYGVSVNQAAISARALELGLVDSTSEIDIQTRAVAALNLLYQQTTGAQGQFAREADTTAGQLERIGAQAENAKASIGEALVPAFQQLLDLAPPLIEAIENGLIPAFAGISESTSDVDTAGFVAFISGLPQAFETVVQQSSAAGEAVGNAFQTFGALARLDFGDLGTQFQQLGDDIQSFREGGIENQAIQNFISTLSAGVDPAQAFASTIVALGEDVSSLTVESFEGLANQLVAMAEAAGVTGPEMASLADSIEEFGQDAGFSAEGVEILVGLLREIAEDQAIEAQLERDISGLLRLGAAARDATQPIQRNAEAIAEFQARVGEIRAGQIAEELEGIGSVFDQLPDGMDAAAEALRDSEDEIVTDFTDFLGNLEDEIEARRAFRSNIAILQAMGLDDLAAVFAEEGLDAAAALADAVANPEEARRAEELLDEEATSIGNSFRDTLIATIEGQGLDLSLAADATIAIQSLVLSGLDTAAAQAEVGNQVRDAVGGVGSAGADRNAGITNVQNFQGFTPSDTDLARAAQSVNAITVD